MSKKKMKPDDGIGVCAEILRLMDKAADDHYKQMVSVPMNCMGYGSAMHDLRHIIGEMYPELKD